MRSGTVGAVLALALVTGGCSEDEADESTSGSEAAPVLGAWHELVTDPGGGVLLVNGHPEDATAPGPVELWRWDGPAWERVAADGPAPGSTERHQEVWEWSGDPATPAVEVPTGE